MATLWLGALWFATVAASMTVGISEELQLASLVAVTEDRAELSDGCDAISVFAIGRERAVHRGRTQISPGRLATASDFSHLLSTHNNSDSFIYVLGTGNEELSVWRSGILLQAEQATKGAIAVLPGDSGFVVASASVNRRSLWRNDPPFYVRKYPMPGLVASEMRAGPEIARAAVDGVAAEILISADGDQLHVLTDHNSVYSLALDSLEQSAAPISVPPLEGLENGTHTTLPWMHAALSVDGRYLVSNRGRAPDLNVVDLVERKARSVTLSGDVEVTGGVAINHGWVNAGLLALHGADKVIVYEYQPPAKLVERGRALIAPPSRWDSTYAPQFGPHLAIAWSGDGSHIIAATEAGQAEFVVLRVEDNGRQLTAVQYLRACNSPPNLANDIITLNGRLSPPVTPTNTPTATPTVTPTLPAPTNTAAPTASATNTPSPSPVPTRMPRPVYLPVAVKEHCDPSRQHADVALVIDASTSMLEKTRAGRTKLAAAAEAVQLFVAELKLPQDQAAIVEFNGGVRLLQQLTGSRTSLDEALMGIEVRLQTRIDLGVEKAHRELMSARHLAGNGRVMVVLTDGQANPVGPEAAVREADAAKADGVTIFTVGLGEDLDLEALEAMASKREYFYRAPDAEDLAAIYGEIAVEIPCPAQEFWGGR